MNEVTKSFLTSPERAAKKGGFYLIEDSAIDQDVLPPQTYEYLLGQIEAHATTAIDELLTDGPRDLHPDHMVWLSVFIAHQITRGRAFRAEQDALPNESLRVTHPATRAHARDLIRQGNGLVTAEEVEATLRVLRQFHTGDIKAAQSVASLVGMGGETAMILAPHLMSRNWCLYIDSSSSLITCDEPIIVLNGPPGDRRESGGYGTAAIILFPLSPYALLAMFHPEVPMDLATSNQTSAPWRRLRSTADRCQLEHLDVRTT